MKKSVKTKKSEKPPEVDYSKLPAEIKKRAGNQPYVIEEKAKLTWDNKQFLVRIPTEIAEELGITQGNRVVFRLTKPPPGAAEKPKVEIYFE